MKTRKRRDIGRIGSDQRTGAVPGQESSRLHDQRLRPPRPLYAGDRTGWSSLRNPCRMTAGYQTGWHSVFYDVAPSPDRECVYASTWTPQPRPDADLAERRRLAAGGGSWARRRRTRTSLSRRACSRTIAAASPSPATASCTTWPRAGAIPSTTPRMPSRDANEGVVWRLDPETLKREEVTPLKHPSRVANYVSRGSGRSQRRSVLRAHRVAARRASSR